MTDTAKLALSLLDLTSLSESDTKESIRTLCAKAVTPFAHVAAVCVYPQFLSLCRETLDNTGVNFAAVANFPAGNEGLKAAIQQTRKIIELGGNEVDVVVPYQEWIAGNKTSSPDLVKACKDVCGANVSLKVILESGAFANQAELYELSQASISSGADFIKTSTGKTDVSATLEAAQTMLEAIRDSGKACGFKASGGIRTHAQAVEYMELASKIMGEHWISPETFRFGASGLLNDLLSILGHKELAAEQGGY
ncbi:deoxyribose-phosphate aldolase [Kiloniella laminariae]|uniref:Deoxyribose-phosphate aldolase n=1 Tax=Kiloniella laminariae TaxID=454162 RepID=A0ABT4LNJ2_9PROT|nr:deoxyribose-phosphate aldolase [Kiloniella laminariae]MCZ4282673.1 deoxyribose-phosphate aldolase [Kiloniella laminariae]